MVRPPFGLSLEDCLGALHISLTDWVKKESLSAAELEFLAGVPDQLAKGMPIAYICGKSSFMGLELTVNPSVLIPRQETEEWVRFWLQSFSISKHARILEVGTGSGAIALGVKKERPDLRVVASDLSFQALEVARQNAKKLGMPVSFIQADLLEGFALKKFEWVISNPPYIGEREEVGLDDSLKFEPKMALFFGEDGLGLHRTLLKMAPSFLKSGGGMMLEHGPGQGTQLKIEFPGLGLDVFLDEAGRERATFFIND